MKTLGRIALLWLVGAVIAGQVLADSAMLPPDADTSLFATAPDNNLGSNSNLVSGANGSGLPGRALVHFDLAGAVPSNAVIQSVALTLKVVIVPGGGGVASVFDLRRMLTNWIEGTGTGNTGSAANDGETTWNNRLHPSTPWTIPGGALSNDFSGTVSASMQIGDLGSYTFLSTTGLVADVQQWLVNPASNFGWMLISESEGTAFTARRFGAREDTNNAPILTVQYSLPVVPDIQSIKATGSQIQFSFLAAAGQSYTVQFQDALNSGDWLTLTNIAPQGVTTNLTVIDPFPTNTQRFYRIATF